MRYRATIKYALPYMVALFAAGNVGHALAGTVRVNFDVSPTAAAEEIGDADFQERNPDEKLVQVRLHASALITQGNANQVAECLFHFYSPAARLIVHDFSPQTTLSSDVVGNVDVTENREEGGNVQLSVGGQYEDLVHGNLGGSGNRSQSEVAHFERLPEQEVLTVSGRTARGSGAYFKLKSTTQTSVEGSHDFFDTIPRTTSLARRLFACHVHRTHAGRSELWAVLLVSPALRPR